jgi:group I intron endonuclease
MIKCGIYSITNTVNKKSYIGSSSDIFSRFGKHQWLLNKNIHSNSHLQNAWNKYGFNPFLFSILYETPKENLLIEEQKQLDICKSNPSLYYNISYSAESPNLGLKMSDEAKRKISLALTGRILSEETKRKMGDSKRGIALSKEHKQKACKNLRPWPKGKKRFTSWNKGICWNVNSKKKMSDAKLGKVSFFKGKTHSKESKEKMRQSAIKRHERNRR